MGVIVIRDAEHAWEGPPADWAGKVKAGEPEVFHKTLLPAEPRLPALHRIRYEPRHFEPPHTHPEDEVIYLLAGDINLGDRTLGPGDALYVPKETRYSLQAGDAGCEFVRVGLKNGVGG